MNEKDDEIPGPSDPPVDATIVNDGSTLIDGASNEPPSGQLYAGNVAHIFHDQYETLTS